MQCSIVVCGAVQPSAMQCVPYLVGQPQTPSLGAGLVDPALHANDAVPYPTVHLPLVAHHHEHLAIGWRELHTQQPLITGGTAIITSTTAHTATNHHCWYYCTHSNHSLITAGTTAHTTTTHHWRYYCTNSHHSSLEVLLHTQQSFITGGTTAHTATTHYRWYNCTHSNHSLLEVLLHTQQPLITASTTISTGTTAHTATTPSSLQYYYLHWYYCTHSNHSLITAVLLSPSYCLFSQGGRVLQTQQPLRHHY